MPTSELHSLKRRIEDLEEIHRLAESLSAVVTEVETLEAILGCCIKLSRAERAAAVLFARAPGGNARTLARAHSASENEIDHIVNDLIAGWVSHHRTPFLTKDLVAELRIQRPTEQIRSLGPALAVPLEVGGKILGTINLVNSRNTRNFSDDDVRLISTVAPLAARAISRSRMIEALNSDNTRLKNALQEQHGLHRLMGNSQVMQLIRQRVSQVASSDVSVLLTGETGTGKELVARAIHSIGPRAASPFIAINCAAIPEHLVESELFGHERGAFTGATELRRGKFELAQDGTLFLDEVSSMSLSLQPTLLRVLEERTICRVGSSVDIPVNVRVIAATNADLREAVSKGAFREDLYQRLHVIPISLPPLRKRREDIPLLAETFLREISNGVKQFSPDALATLQSKEWKGNVRELRNTVERLALLTQSTTLSSTDLQSIESTEDFLPTGDLSTVLHRFMRTQGGQNLFDLAEQQLTQLAINDTSGNITQAARLLGIDRNALQRRLEKFGIKPPAK